MAATSQPSRRFTPNRRRRVRHKVHVPAYATFSGVPKGEMQDLYEVLDISETGVAVQCSSQLQTDQQIDLCLDLAEAGEQIHTSAKVIWSDPTGRAGFSLSALPPPAILCVRQWLFLNAIAAAGNAAARGMPLSKVPPEATVRPNYTDTLTAASAVQREADSLGTDLVAILSLVASRACSMLRASGSAIALVGEDTDTMICRASSGDSAPPVGATLRIGSGFSGECVRSAKVLICSDTETDERVDRETCRALGVRSILACPIIASGKAIGLIELFSPNAAGFTENDGAVLQRFAETIFAAVRRAIAGTTAVPATPTQNFAPQGSILFASEAEPKKEDKSRGGHEKQDKAITSDPNEIGGIRLPRAHLILLMAAAATIAMALGFILAPWIQEKLIEHDRAAEHTVLASSPAPAEVSKAAALPSVDTADPKQLRELAEQGDPAAENALGLLYAQGDEKHAVRHDETEAARWFTKAAEHNYVPAQSKLGALYWGGRGVPASLNQAYFWTILARAGGDEGSKTLAPLLASHMTRAQATAIEQQAEIWYQQHESSTKAQTSR
jgi:putative methionine-R-sulfoxide reductase with GAF domain